MGGAAPVPGKSRRRALDAALNVVPFIDLLSCCIAFLLITAVWTSLATMPVAARGSGGGEGEAPPVTLSLFVDTDGYTLTRSTGESDPIPLRAGEHDRARLAERLLALRQALPSVDALTVRPADLVRYEEIVRTMDVAKAARFDDVSVAGRE